MTPRFTRAHRELIRRCDEVLHYLWDPIGIAGEPGARDEYDAYWPSVARLLLAGTTREALAEYLVEVETERMGLEPRREHALETADRLLAWHEWIVEYVTP